LDGVLSEAFVDAMARLAHLPDHRCSEPWEWSGHAGLPLQVRDALYRSLEEELGAVAAQSAPASEAARLLAVGQRAWGELRGLLLGLPDALLDQAGEPPPGSPGAGEPQEEWTLRRVLAHVLLTERRYREQVEYALRRSDDEPLRREPMARVSPGDEEGGQRRWVERLGAARRAGAALGGASAEQLLRPTVWSGYEVDVRFRMLRFAGHLVEHTVQAEKLVATGGHRIGESHMIVRRISAARGAHELSTPIEVLAQLDAAHTERAASLAPST
jgi:DinB family protein